ncbi:MAG TPA: hypothetical protein VIY73_18425 [Polyangiaceae bacterium]
MTRALYGVLVAVVLAIGCGELSINHGAWTLVVHAGGVTVVVAV